MAKQTSKQAVEQRTQQRLAARKDATQRGVETRKRNRDAQLAELKQHEAKLATESKKLREAESAAEPQAEQPEVAKQRAKRPERSVAQGTPAPDPAAMVTVARAPRGVRCESPNALVTR